MEITLRGIAVATLLASAGVALAHGGAYRPPPPRNPTNPRGPTPPGRRIPAVTPGGGGGVAVTPGGEAEPPSVDDWTRWWFANRRLLIPERSVAEAPRDGATSADPAWRDRARDALRAGAADRDLEISSSSAVALGKLRDLDSTPLLAGLLRDAARPQAVREGAAVGLALLGPGTGQLVHVGAEALLDVATAGGEDDRLRAVCTYALALRRDDDAHEALYRAAATTENDSLQFAALAGLGMLGEADVRATLEKELARRGEKHRGVRVYAAQGLARLGGTDSVVALRTAATKHRDANTRRAAALALGVVAAGDDATAVVLAAMLRDDPDPSCRGAAALGLGRLAASQAGTALLAALDAKEKDVRPYAALGLGLLAARTGDAETARPLLARLEQAGDDGLRGAAACGLGLARAEYAGAALRRIVQERGEPRLRAHAAFALGHLGGGVEDLQALRELLIEREHDWMPREAALALGRLGDRQSVRVLRRLMEDGSTLHVQAAGALALGSIGGEEAARALTDMLAKGTQPTLTRGMAAVALGRMLDRERALTLTRIGADLDWHLFTPAVDEILTIL